MFSYVHKKSALPDFSDSAFCMKGNLLVAYMSFQVNHVIIFIVGKITHSRKTIQYL